MRVAQAYVREDRNIERVPVDGAAATSRAGSTPSGSVRPLLPVRAVPRRPGRRHRARGSAPLLVRDGTVTTGTVIAFLLYLDQFFSPIQQLSQVLDTWQQAVGVDDQDRRAAAHPGLTPDAGRPGRPPGGCAGAVELRGGALRATRAPGGEALAGVDLDVGPGETVALVGETGAGQVDHREAGGPLLRPDRRPRSLVDGTTGRRHRPRGVPPPARRRAPGGVPLHRAPCATTSPTAGPTPPTPRSRRRPGPSAPTTSSPGCRGGYLHPVTERGRSLSSGQRQLICLARARLVDPAILLLDEATSHLDLAARRGCSGRWASSPGRTTILVAHRLQTARTADRIVVIDDGRIVEQGSHDELLARGGAYAELWNRNLDASISPYAASRPS